MKKVILSTPIKMGDKKIKDIEIREPKAGELRGISASEILQIDVGAYEKLLPRITSPAMTAQQVADLGLKDFAKFTRVVIGFFADSIEDSPTA